MLDVSTIGMVVIFVMAFGIVSWQANRVRKAEERVEELVKSLEPEPIEADIPGESADQYAERIGLKKWN